MTATMTAITQDELGGPEVLRLGQVERPAPRVGEILVRVRAAGVNPVDGMNRASGLFSGRPPFILGWDVSGIVEEVGPGVTLVGPGDEVFGLLPFPYRGGAYAEYVVAPTRAFAPKPAMLDHVQAAALPLAGLTAWQALVDTARIGAGSRVLITGASGGVGHLAVQIAAARGADVVGLASAAHLDAVRGHGATDVLDYRAVDFSTALSDLDAVFDVVGDDYPVRAVRTLKPGGILVSALPQTLGPARPAAAERGVRLAGLFVESDRAGLLALSELVARGALRPTIAAVLPLSEAASAHANHHGPGKVVLTVG